MCKSALSLEQVCFKDLKHKCLSFNLSYLIVKQFEHFCHNGHFVHTTAPMCTQLLFTFY